MQSGLELRPRARRAHGGAGVGARGGGGGATCRSRTRHACRGFARNFRTMRVACRDEPRCQLSHYDNVDSPFITLNEMHLISPDSLAIKSCEFRLKFNSKFRKLLSSDILWMLILLPNHTSESSK